MSKKKLFVGGLSWDTTDASLKQAFEAFGELESARVVTDRETGRSRGFGFVEFKEERAQEAMNKLNGTDLDGRTIKVDLATEGQGSKAGGGAGGFRSGAPSRNGGGGNGGYRR